MNPEWADFLAEIERRRTASYEMATDLSDEGKDAERAFGKVDAYDEVLRLISSLGAVFPESRDLPPVGPDGMRDLTCGACGGTFRTNFREDEIECAHCDARRCPHCGEWFGRDD